MTRGRGERLGEEDDVGIGLVHGRDHPLPERERLRVRIVDTEHADPALDPEADDVEQRRPQALAVGGVEVERVDVFVPLRRVLGVRDRPVGTVTEPSRVLAHPRMVGRRLEREVERDLEVVGARGLDEGFDIGDGAELRDARRCGHPRRRRSPTGCPGSWARAAVALLRPLR